MTPQPSKKKRRWLLWIVIGTVGVLFLCIIIAALSGGNDKDTAAVSPTVPAQPADAIKETPGPTVTPISVPTTASVAESQASAAEPTAAGEPAATPTDAPLPPTEAPTATMAPTPEGPATSFGDGTWRVGIDILPGTYRATDGSNCYWERLSGFDGSFNSIIANENAKSPALVTIAETDVGFSCKRCGTWVLAETDVPAAPATEFAEGTWRVGVDIVPGVYRAANAQRCYWARLSGFGGEFDDLLTNDNVDGPAVVAIDEGDIGFTSSRCGTWVLAETDEPETPATEFSDGVWRVGVDIAPGTYRSSATERCYWERLSGFSGGFGGIIANDNPDGQALVTISPSDAGFSCARCGTWVLVER